MQKKTYSIRVDESTKTQFDAVCEEIGIAPSSAMNLFITTVVRERKIPFEMKAASGKEEK